MQSATVLPFPNAGSEEPDAPKAELRHIMHVDDDEDIRTIIKMALEVVGSFEVTQFSCGSEAIAGSGSIQPQLMLLDVMMPDMSGQELWQTLIESEHMKTTPAVFLTAKAEDDFSQMLMQAGALAVITKPVDPMTLAQRLLDIWAEM